MIPCSVLRERMGMDGWYIGGRKAGLDWSMEMNRLFVYILTVSLMCASHHLDVADYGMAGCSFHLNALFGTFTWQRALAPRRESTAVITTPDLTSHLRRAHHVSSSPSSLRFTRGHKRCWTLSQHARHLLFYSLVSVFSLPPSSRWRSPKRFLNLKSKYSSRAPRLKSTSTTMIKLRTVRSLNSSKPRLVTTSKSNTASLLGSAYVTPCYSSWTLTASMPTLLFPTLAVLFAGTARMPSRDRGNSKMVDTS